MLTDASLGPATSVTDPNCTPSGSAPFLKLRDVHQGLDQVRPSQWMEISGELKSMRDEDDLRTFEVESFSQVPVSESSGPLHPDNPNTEGGCCRPPSQSAWGNAGDGSAKLSRTGSSSRT